MSTQFSSSEFEKPISCPKCGKPLERIDITKNITLVYLKEESDESESESEGTFEESDVEGDTTIKCAECQETIGYSSLKCSWGIYPTGNW